MALSYGTKTADSAFATAANGLANGSVGVAATMTTATGEIDHELEVTIVTGTGTSATGYVLIVLRTSDGTTPESTALDSSGYPKAMRVLKRLPCGADSTSTTAKVNVSDRYPVMPQNSALGVVNLTGAPLASTGNAATRTTVSA